jgi:ketosteroid isomerase-like protein
MSQENVEVVRAAYAAIDARDFRRVNELARSDIEWIPDRRVGAEPIRGRDKVIEFFTDRGVDVRRDRCRAGAGMGPW